MGASVQVSFGMQMIDAVKAGPCSQRGLTLLTRVIRPVSIAMLIYRSMRSRVDAIKRPGWTTVVRKATSCLLIQSRR
jgi:hypothetical protein